MELSQEEKIILLRAARASIKSIFDNKRIDEPDYDKFPRLKLKCGAFVTLTEFDKLRGCIGYIFSDLTAFRTVCNAAVQAAQNDPRFFPVTEPELDNIKIEISLLSEPYPINSYDEIVIGKDGLIMEEKGRRGLLLPQVPVEHNLNREQYLSAICEKTGFSKDYWKTRKINLSGFTALVFNENELVTE